MEDFDKNEFLKGVERTFGAYRAEWLREDLFKQFARPSYFYALEEIRPCVLQGGRGSGKTTALRGLSYKGQYQLQGSDIRVFDENVKYIGLYECFDTNHVRALSGEDIALDRWGKYFGHYFNLLIVLDLLKFLEWHYQLSTGEKCLSEGSMQEVLSRLGISYLGDVSYGKMIELVENKLYEFQDVVNNIKYYDSHPEDVFLSVVGVPIRILAEKIVELPQFVGKHVYIIVDEYENLEDYQQVIINTLVKHSANVFTFKIGVRELGWRVKHTLNKDEVINDPADYALLDIKDSFSHREGFSEFAKNVCQKRFEALFQREIDVKIDELFPGMTFEDEAVALGVEEHDLLKEFVTLPDEIKAIAKDLPSLYKFALAYWAKVHKLSLSDVMLEYENSKEVWDDRYDNYKYHLLFKIKTGRGSVGIQKYYTGFETYVKLASCNIRFLIELIHDAYVAHIENGFSPTDTISPTIQTQQAKALALKRLTQVECECGEGSQIVRLMTGLGRCFEQLAKEMQPRKPEVTQFCCDDMEQEPGLVRVINAAVRTGAIERTSSNKLSGNEVRSFDYNIHPIFAPHFGYSFRRKRKMPLPARILRVFTENPGEGLRLLHLKGIDAVAEAGFEQLKFDF